MINQSTEIRNSFFIIEERRRRKLWSQREDDKFMMSVVNGKEKEDEGNENAPLMAQNYSYLNSCVEGEQCERVERE